MSRYRLTTDQADRLIAYALEHMTANGNGHTPPKPRGPYPQDAEAEEVGASQDERDRAGPSIENHDKTMGRLAEGERPRDVKD